MLKLTSLLMFTCSQNWTVLFKKRERSDCMRLALFLPPQPTEMWRLAAQLGVTDAVGSLPRGRDGVTPLWDYLSLLHMQQRFADAALNLSVIESSPPMDKVKLG